MIIKIVSACLAGVNCRFDGKNSATVCIKEMVKSGRALPLCPEQLGGLSTPRAPSEISGGDGADVLAGRERVINSAHEDVTEQYLRGAEEVLKIAKLSGAAEAVLKDRSPACGCAKIYRGGNLVEGAGVCAALLKKEGIKVTGEGGE